MSIVAKVIKKALYKIHFRIELKQMDAIWYILGGNCFGMFPPSFYYTHTEEEIERITAEKVEELLKIIDQMREIGCSQS